MWSNLRDFERSDQGNAQLGKGYKKGFYRFLKKKMLEIKKIAASGILLNIFRLAKGESILYTIICAKSLSPESQQMKDGVRLLP